MKSLNSDAANSNEMIKKIQVIQNKNHYQDLTLSLSLTLTLTTHLLTL